MPHHHHVTFTPARAPVAISMFNSDSSEETVATDTSTDPFEAYTPGQKNLASKDTVTGTGEASKDGDIVTIAYKGEVLKTGEVFDEGTFTFKIGERKVIKGWDSGLLDMKVGGRRSLKIPPNLAYGSKGAGDKIPANADLKFDCELTYVGSGTVAEAKIFADGVINRIKSPRGAVLAVLFALSILIPKDAQLGDLFR
jgi:FKBP-type peptidyl-prolyl cis-trans isomerase